jgi:glycosyltransferase involved in cell wall biosynthesis
MNVSVCIATYNGEKYLLDQIASILVQLTHDDEVIVVDDFSNDNTVKLLRDFNDPRIRIYLNDRNRKHVFSFARAISLAKNEIVMLSDQDDIWVKGKVNKIKEAFENSKNISLIYHNIIPIDTFGKVLESKFPLYSGGTRNSLKFIIRQLIKPQIYGCACSLSRKKIRNLLPFPKSVYAHDHWIAVWAAINGQVLFLHDSLVRYRQHSNNLSPKKHLPLQTCIILRIKLLMQIFIAIWRRIIRIFE